jgi:hypothetical protein
MHLYSGTSVEFISDATRNVIAEKLEQRFLERFRYSPGKSEVRSWQNSLSRMAGVLRDVDLTDNGVVVELQLPLSSKRLDCMITGHDGSDRASAVIVELKQWDAVSPSPVMGCVTTFTGRGMRDVLHPSDQAGSYQRYLLDTHTAFGEGQIRLEACAWLHNLPTAHADAILNDEHAELLALNPSFLGDTVSELETYLDGTLHGGAGLPVMEEVLLGRYRPHKRLLDHVARTVAAEPTYVLLDEQKVAFNHILTIVRSSRLDDQRTVFLVRGGPGTGKSVIAVNLVGELAREGYTINHATGSKAFTETLRSVVGRRAAAVFSYYRNFSTAEPDGLDVLVLDEAHRIRETSDNRFTKKSDRSTRPQVDELVAAARTSVFFIDDMQVVRPGEAGSSALIRDAAAQSGARLIEHELETQFRCGGLLLLGLRREGTPLRRGAAVRAVRDHDLARRHRGRLCPGPALLPEPAKRRTTLSDHEGLLELEAGLPLDRGTRERPRRPVRPGGHHRGRHGTRPRRGKGDGPEPRLPAHDPAPRARRTGRGSSRARERRRAHDRARQQADSATGEGAAGPRRGHLRLG